MKSVSPKTTAIAIINAMIYYTLYLAFTSKMGFRELIAGGLVCIIATVATLVFSTTGRVRFRFHWTDLIQAWRIPWYAITGTFEVLQGLYRQLFTRAGALSFLSARRFQIGDRDSPYGHGRFALTITYTTSTPNSIVLDIIPEQKLLLLHQIIPGKIHTMTRNLGAHS